MKDCTRFINGQLLFLLLIYLPVFTFAQLQFKYWSIKPIDSKVKEMTIWSYRYPTKDDSVLWNRKTYNDKGLLILEKGYLTYIDNRNYVTSEYVYDSLNRIIEQTDMKYGRKHVYKFAFDTLNRSVRLDHFVDTSLYEYGIWKYNKNGWLISRSDYWGNGRVDRESTFEYSDNGKTITWLDEDFFSGRFIYKLSPKNEVIEMIGFMSDSVVSAVTYLTYNKRGNITEEKETDRGAVNKTTTYTYDKSGNELAVYVCDMYGKKRLTREKSYKNGLLNTVIYYDEKELPEVKEVYTYILRE